MIHVEFSGFDLAGWFLRSENASSGGGITDWLCGRCCRFPPGILFWHVAAECTWKSLKVKIRGRGNSLAGGHCYHPAPVCLAVLTTASATLCHGTLLKTTRALIRLRATVSGSAIWRSQESAYETFAAPLPFAAFAAISA